MLRLTVVDLAKDPTTSASQRVFPRIHATMIWSIRIAVICYVARLVLAKCRVVGRAPSRLEAAIWSIGCIAYIIHVVAAFSIAHNWSHSEAWEFTAIETQRMVGIRRGDGVWVNYAFTIVWMIDVWRVASSAIEKRPTNPRVDVGIHLLFAFIVFSATVVFGPSLYRYLAVPVGFLLLLAWRSGRSCVEHSSKQDQSVKPPDDL